MAVLPFVSGGLPAVGLLAQNQRKSNNMSILGGIISGIGSLIGGTVSGVSQAKAQREANEANLEIARQNNETSLKIARENNELQQAMLRENNEFNRQQAIDMFNLENAYNTPLAQIQRLREAGLNPAVMMEGAGGTAVGNSDASTPSAAAAGISPSMPSLTTPHMEAVPSFAVGFLDALQSLSNIKLVNAQAGKLDKETSWIDQMSNAQVLQMFSDMKLKDSQAAYQDVLTRIENTYGASKRSAEIAKLVSDYYLNSMKGKTEEAQADLAKAEKLLVDTKNVNEQAQAPIILENLRKAGREIEERINTEKSKQSANYASAEESRERANITRKEAKLLEDQHDDLVYARRLENAKNFQELGEMSTTWIYRFEELKNRRLISDEQVKEAREAVERARKENSWFWWNKAIETVERINNGANKWAPWALSRDDGSPNGNIITWSPSSVYNNVY